MKVFYAIQILCVILAASSVTAAKEKDQRKKQEDQGETKVARQSLQDSSDSILREFERLRNDVEQLVNHDTNGHWVDPFNTLSALGLDDLSKVGLSILPEGEQEQLEPAGFRFPLKHSMALDVREDDDKYDMSVDVPGIPKDKIDIDLDDDVLTIRAHDEGRQVSKGEKKWGNLASPGKVWWQARKVYETSPWS
eukprot:gb/GECG01010005.1/.p1 GENE.gb/GECG01010005.1/~~gb/GECG01010005.1/.p1  ORF type:complete len:194 (+),score=30.28 gb/GECG01010005.1/:1-582(+)